MKNQTKNQVKTKDQQRIDTLVKELNDTGRENIRLNEVQTQLRAEVTNLRKLTRKMTGRLIERVSQLSKVSQTWRRFLAGKEIGAPAETVEELRTDAHGSLVMLMGVSLEEPVIGEGYNASGDDCCTQAGADYPPQAMMAGCTSGNAYRGAH